MGTSSGLEPFLLTKGEGLGTLAAVFAAAGSGPVLLIAAISGYGTLHDFGLRMILPSILILAFLGLLAEWQGWKRLSSGLLASLWIGILSTFGLDAVREIGFRLFHAMPGISQC